MKKNIATKIIIAIIGIIFISVIAAICLKSISNNKQEAAKINQQQTDITTQISDDKSEKEFVDDDNLEEDAYILSESNSRLIEYTEILDFDIETLNLAKNEIYARHGYIFDTDSIAKHFQKCKWYTPSVKSSEFKDSVFNQYEIQNIKLLEDYEKASGYTYPLEVKNGKSVQIDLDGDGRLEKVSFKKKKSKQRDSSDDTDITISVDDDALKYRCYEGESAVLYIVDINTSDKAKEICLETWEPNDYTGGVYWQYTAGHELSRITFEDYDYYNESLQEEEEYKYLPTFGSYGGGKYLGDGRVIFAGGCLAITQLVVNFEYRLTDNGTFQYINREYKAGEDFADFFTEKKDIIITSKKNFVMYENHSKSSKKITVKPQKLKIVSVYRDDSEEYEYWAKIELEDKSTGWVPPFKQLDIQELEKMFDGLHFWG